MTRVFLDTLGLVAVVNAADQWHAQAEPIWRRMMQSKARMVTTSLVLVELGDGLAKVHQRKLATQLYDRLGRSKRIEIIQITEQHVARGWELVRQRDVKDWGLTDCISMLTMNDLGLREVFTADHHFSQAGFEILLKMS